MGARRHGQEGALAPVWECCKMFCALDWYGSYSNLYVGFWRLRPQIPILGLHPWTPRKDFCPQPPNLPLEKILRAPMLTTVGIRADAMLRLFQIIALVTVNNPA